MESVEQIESAIKRLENSLEVITNEGKRLWLVSHLKSDIGRLRGLKMQYYRNLMRG